MISEVETAVVKLGDEWLDQRPGFFEDCCREFVCPRGCIACQQDCVLYRLSIDDWGRELFGRDSWAIYRDVSNFCISFEEIVY